MWCGGVSGQRAGQKVPHPGQDEAVHTRSTNPRRGCPRWLSEQCMLFKVLPTKLVKFNGINSTGALFVFLLIKMFVIKVF